MLRVTTMLVGALWLVQSAMALDAYEHYVPGELTVRFFEHPAVVEADGALSLGLPGLDLLNREQPLLTIEPLYPHYKMQTTPDLSLDYVLHFDESTDLIILAEKYAATGLVEYAEPNWLLPMERMPNDENTGLQWYLERIEASEAWDILPETPDYPETIIAIIDSGVDWNHPDLIQNLWVNPGEDLDGDEFVPFGSTPGDPDDINNADDDDNGYSDDFYGYDFVNTCNGAQGEDCSGEDNNPMDFNGHGTHCSGLAAGRTNNGLGMASPSWNARIMCLRAGYEDPAGDGFVIQNDAAQGIYYAMANGAKIISMSFGGSTVLRTPATAAYAAGLLCLHAGGNDDVSTYDQLDLATGMVSVAATDQNDCKAEFSQFGNWVDISAPGVAMYATIFNDEYEYLQGTSMACPLTASVAALIWNVDPELNNQEVRARLLGTVDDIYHLSCNADYQGQLGSGRINAYQAAYDIRLTELEWVDYELSDESGDGRYTAGETVDVAFAVRNTGINHSDSLICRLNSDDGYVSISEPVLTLEPVNSGATRVVHMTATLLAGAPAHFLTLNLLVESANVNESLEHSTELMTGTTTCLLYDDSQPADSVYSTYYTAFRQVGQVFDWYQPGGFPDMPGVSFDLNNYDHVVYASGRSTSTMDESEQTLFSGWLSSSSNKLIVSSTYLNEDLGGSDFFTNVMHASSGEGSSSMRSVRGLPAGEYCDGYWLLLQGVGGSNDQDLPISEINALNGAQVMFQDHASAFTTGIYTDNLVYMAFALEAASGLSTSQSVSDVLNELWGSYLHVEEATQQPLTTRLCGVYPNPFNPVTRIVVEMQQAGEVDLCVYNLLGQEAARLAQGPLTAGSHTFTFDGSQFASGVYLGVLNVGGRRVDVAKMLLVR